MKIINMEGIAFLQALSIPFHQGNKTAFLYSNGMTHSIPSMIPQYQTNPTSLLVWIFFFALFVSHVFSMICNVYKEYSLFSILQIFFCLINGQCSKIKNKNLNCEIPHPDSVKILIIPI